MNDKDCCGRCFYFFDLLNECRRYPPVFVKWDIVLNIGVFRFPVLRSDMYGCGEFKNNNKHIMENKDQGVIMKELIMKYTFYLIVFASGAAVGLTLMVGVALMAWLIS